MLTTHLLGHVYVTLGNKTIPVSAKALALIIYLQIEKVPQHREKLADMLWNSLEARKNLRVELARIRSAGLNIFPSSHQLLQLENVTSDFNTWCAQFNQNMNQQQLTASLAMLRGSPLTGLEDLGGAIFQSWVDQQRWLMIQQIEHHLSRAYWRYMRENQIWATRLISERAEALGLENPAEMPPTLQDNSAPSAPESEMDLLTPASSISSVPHRVSAIHFERPHEESVISQMFRQALERSQLMVLHGPPGSGKSYLSDHMIRRAGWQSIRVSGMRSCRFVLASVTQELIDICEPQDVQTLKDVLFHPASLEEDVVKVAYALSKVAVPLVLLFEQAQEASTELISLMEFLFRSSGHGQRVFMLLSRDGSAHVPLIRALLHRIERTSTVELELSPLTNGSIQRVVEAQFPFEPKQRLRIYAARLSQRSQGNTHHLLSLIDQAPDLGTIYAMPLPQGLRDSHDSEIDACSVELQFALKRLSVIYGNFGQEAAEAALSELYSGQVTVVLEEALSRRLLVEADPEVPLSWSHGVVESTAYAQRPTYIFRTEGLRITVTSDLSPSLRHEIRRRLMSFYTVHNPGHAAYYARRAHLTDDAVRLSKLYHLSLPEDSPLLHMPSDQGGVSAHIPGPLLDLPPEVEVHFPDPPDLQLSRQGYSVFRGADTLGVVSSNRYALPSTLSIHFQLPADTPSATVIRIRWRLDLYRGGEELGPVVAPFPLRLRLLETGTAHVLTPLKLDDYTEAGIKHVVHSAVEADGWMNHQFSFPPSGRATARTLELSVRAVDVVLMVKELLYNDLSLISNQKTVAMAQPAASSLQQAVLAEPSLLRD